LSINYRDVSNLRTSRDRRLAGPGDLCGDVASKSCCVQLYQTKKEIQCSETQELSVIENGCRSERQIEIEHCGSRRGTLVRLVESEGCYIYSEQTNERIISLVSNTE
jgi:hypothetical protein